MDSVAVQRCRTYARLYNPLALMVVVVVVVMNSSRASRIGYKKNNHQREL